MADAHALIAQAHGTDLQAAIHDRIAEIAMTGAEETADSQVRIGVLAWAHDTERIHRAAARELVSTGRSLYEQAAASDALRSLGAAH